MNSLELLSYAYRKYFLQCWYWKETKACPTKCVRLNKNELSSANCLLSTNLQSLMKSIFLGMVANLFSVMLDLTYARSSLLSSSNLAFYSISFQMDSSIISNLFRLQHKEIDFTISRDLSSPSLDFSSSRKSPSLESAGCDHSALFQTHAFILCYRYYSKCFLQKNQVLCPLTQLWLGKSRIGMLLIKTAQESQLKFLEWMNLCQEFFWHLYTRKQRIEAAKAPKQRQFTTFKSSPFSLAKLLVVDLQIYWEKSGRMSLSWHADTLTKTQIELREKIKQRTMVALSKEKQTAIPDGSLNYSQFQATQTELEVVEQQIGTGQFSILSQQQGQTTGMRSLRLFLQPNLEASRWSLAAPMLAGQSQTDLLLSSYFFMFY